MVRSSSESAFWYSTELLLSLFTALFASSSCTGSAQQSAPACSPKFTRGNPTRVMAARKLGSSISPLQHTHAHAGTSRLYLRSEGALRLLEALQTSSHSPDP